MRKRRPLKFFLVLNRTVAIFLSISLILSESLGYASSAKNSSLIDVPSSWGKAEESHPGNTGKTLIYIQDAHDSLDAQKNIAKIISRLVKEQGVKTVLEEGFEGPVASDRYFGFIKDPKIKQKVSYFLLDKLRIGGAEYAHINRKDDFKLVGADDLKAHRENLKIYRRNAKYQKQNLRELDAMTNELEIMANKFFPEKFKEWMKIKTRYENQELPLADYLRRIGIRLETIRDLDAKSLLAKIQEAENEIAHRFLKSDRDFQIYRYQNNLSILKRLVQTQLSPEEYQAALHMIYETKTQDIANFIAKKGGKSLVLSNRWESRLDHAVEFYELAHQRDLAVEKSLDEWNKSSEKNAVLVFGGFHKNGIREILKRSGHSFVIMTPKMGIPDERHQAYYKQLMSVGRHEFENHLTLAKAASPERGYSWAGALPEIQALERQFLVTPNLPLPQIEKQLTVARSESHFDAEKPGQQASGIKPSDTREIRELKWKKISFMVRANGYELRALGALINYTLSDLRLTWLLFLAGKRKLSVLKDPVVNRADKISKASKESHEFFRNELDRMYQAVDGASSLKDFNGAEPLYLHYWNNYRRELALNREIIVRGSQRLKELLRGNNITRSEARTRQSDLTQWMKTVPGLQENTDKLAERMRWDSSFVPQILDLSSARTQAPKELEAYFAEKSKRGADQQMIQKLPLGRRFNTQRYFLKQLALLKPGTLDLIINTTGDALMQQPLIEAFLKRTSVLLADGGTMYFKVDPMISGGIRGWLPYYEKLLLAYGVRISFEKTFIHLHKNKNTAVPADSKELKKLKSELATTKLKQVFKNRYFLTGLALLLIDIGTKIFFTFYIGSENLLSVEQPAAAMSSSAIQNFYKLFKTLFWGEYSIFLNHHWVPETELFVLTIFSLPIFIITLLFAGKPKNNAHGHFLNYAMAVIIGAAMGNLLEVAATGKATNWFKASVPEGMIIANFADLVILAGTIIVPFLGLIAMGRAFFEFITGGKVFRTLFPKWFVVSILQELETLLAEDPKTDFKKIKAGDLQHKAEVIILNIEGINRQTPNLPNLERINELRDELAELVYPTPTLDRSEMRLDDISVLADSAPLRSEARELSAEELQKLKPAYSGQEAVSFFKNYRAWREANPDKILLVAARHVESVSNLFDFNQSNLSFSPPTIRGMFQGWAFTRLMHQSGIRFGRVISSALERAHFTVAGVSKNQNVKHETLRRLNELVGHPLSGISRKLIMDLYMQYIHRMNEDPMNFEHPGFSGKDQLKNLELLFENIENSEEKDILIGSHGLTIRWIIDILLRIPYQKDGSVLKTIGGSPNVGITAFAYDRTTKKWELLTLYENSYLPESLRDLKDRRTTAELWFEWGFFYARAFWRTFLRLFGISGPIALSDYHPFIPPFLPPTKAQQTVVESTYRRLARMLERNRPKEGEPPAGSARSEMRKIAGRSLAEISMKKVEVMSAEETVRKVHKMATRKDIFDPQASFFIDVMHQNQANVYIGYGVHAALDPDVADAKTLYFRGHYRPERVQNGRTIPTHLAIKPPYLFEEQFANAEALILRDELEEGLYGDLIQLAQFLLKGKMSGETKIMLHEFESLTFIDQFISARFGPDLEMTLEQLAGLPKVLNKPVLTKAETKNLQQYVRDFLSRENQEPYFEQNPQVLLESLLDFNRISIALRPRPQGSQLWQDYIKSIFHHYSEFHRNFLNQMDPALRNKIFSGKLLTGERGHQIRDFLIHHLKKDLDPDRELAEQGVSLRSIEDYSSGRGLDEGSIVNKIVLEKDGTPISLFLKGFGIGRKGLMGKGERQAALYESFYFELSKLLGLNSIESHYYSNNQDPALLGFTLMEEIPGRDTNHLFDLNNTHFTLKSEYTPYQKQLLEEWARLGAVADLIHGGDRRIVQNQHPQYQASYLIDETRLRSGKPALYGIDHNWLFNPDNSSPEIDLRKAGQTEMGIVGALQDFETDEGKARLFGEFSRVYKDQWQDILNKRNEIEGLVVSTFGKNSYEHRILLESLKTSPESHLSRQWQALLDYKSQRSESRRVYAAERLTYERHDFVELLHLLNRYWWLLRDDQLSFGFYEKEGQWKLSPEIIYELDKDNFEYSKGRLAELITERIRQGYLHNEAMVRSGDQQRLADLMAALEIETGAPGLPAANPIRRDPIFWFSPALYPANHLLVLLRRYERNPSPQDFRLLRHWMKILPPSLITGVFFSESWWQDHLQTAGVRAVSAAYATDSAVFIDSASFSIDILLHEFLHILQKRMPLKFRTLPFYRTIQSLINSLPGAEPAKKALRKWGDAALKSGYLPGELGLELGAYFYQMAHEYDRNLQILRDTGSVWGSMAHFVDAVVELKDVAARGKILDAFRSYYLYLSPLIPLPGILRRIEGIDDAFEFPEAEWPKSFNYEKGEDQARQVIQQLQISKEEAGEILQRWDQNQPNPFLWRYKQDGIRKTNIGFLPSGFFKTFDFLRRAGSIGQWTLAFHAGNRNGEGDIIYYLKDYVNGAPQFLMPLNEIQNSLPENPTLSDRIQRDLTAIGFMSEVQKQLSRIARSESRLDADASRQQTFRAGRSESRFVRVPLDEKYAPLIPAVVQYLDFYLKVAMDYRDIINFEDETGSRAIDLKVAEPSVYLEMDPIAGREMILSQNYGGNYYIGDNPIYAEWDMQRRILSAVYVGLDKRGDEYVKFEILHKKRNKPLEPFHINDELFERLAPGGILLPEKLKTALPVTEMVFRSSILKREDFERLQYRSESREPEEIHEQFKLSVDLFPVLWTDPHGNPHAGDITTQTTYLNPEETGKQTVLQELRLNFWPTKDEMKNHPELQTLRLKGDIPGLPKVGSFGYMILRSFSWNGEPALIMTTLQASHGFHRLTKEQKEKYRQWQRVMVNEVAEKAKEAGFRHFFAKTHNTIRQENPHKPQPGKTAMLKTISEASLIEHYFKPFQKWDRQVISTDLENNIEVWHKAFRSESRNEDWPGQTGLIEQGEGFFNWHNLGNPDTKIFRRSFGGDYDATIEITQNGWMAMVRPLEFESNPFLTLHWQRQPDGKFSLTYRDRNGDKQILKDFEQSNALLSWAWSPGSSKTVPTTGMHFSLTLNKAVIGEVPDGMVTSFGTPEGRSRGMGPISWEIKFEDPLPLFEKDAEPISARQREEVFESFVQTHRVMHQTNADGTLFVPTPAIVFSSIFRRIKNIIGPLEGKKFFSLGAGNLTDSLAAAYLHGMQVTAVEKDPRMSQAAAATLNAAQNQELVLPGTIQLLPGQDAFDQSWKDEDVVYFYYTQPGGDRMLRDQYRKEFESRLTQKIQEMKPGAVIAMLFTTGQLMAGHDEYEVLKKLPQQHIKITDEISDVHGGLYLQLYQIPEARRDGEGPDRESRPEQTTRDARPELRTDLTKAQNFSDQYEEPTRKYQNLSDEKAFELARKVFDALDESQNFGTFLDPIKFQGIETRLSESVKLYSAESDLAIQQIGPLIYVIAQDMTPDLLARLRETLQPFLEEYPNNIILTEKAVYFHHSVELGRYTILMISAMLKNAAIFENAVVGDFGAGQGVLSQTASVLGANKVILADYDAERLNDAGMLLEGRDNERHVLNFMDPASKEELEQLARSVDVALINIGPWEEYANANRAVLEALLSGSTTWNLVLNGGYDISREFHSWQRSHNYDLFKNSGYNVTILSEKDSSVIEIKDPSFLSRLVRQKPRSESRTVSADSKDAMDTIVWKKIMQFIGKGPVAVVGNGEEQQTGKTSLVKLGFTNVKTYARAHQLRISENQNPRFKATISFSSHKPFSPKLHQIAEGALKVTLPFKAGELEADELAGIIKKQLISKARKTATNTASQPIVPNSAAVNKARVMAQALFFASDGKKYTATQVRRGIPFHIRLEQLTQLVEGGFLERTKGSQTIRVRSGAYRNSEVHNRVEEVDFYQITAEGKGLLAAAQNDLAAVTENLYQRYQNETGTQRPAIANQKRLLQLRLLKMITDLKQTKKGPYLLRMFQRENQVTSYNFYVYLKELKDSKLITAYPNSRGKLIYSSNINGRQFLTESAGLTEAEQANALHKRKTRDIQTLKKIVREFSKSGPQAPKTYRARSEARTAKNYFDETRRAAVETLILSATSTGISWPIINAGPILPLLLEHPKSFPNLKNIYIVDDQTGKPNLFDIFNFSNGKQIKIEKLSKDEIEKQLASAAQKSAVLISTLPRQNAEEKHGEFLGFKNLRPDTLIFHHKYPVQLYIKGEQAQPIPQNLASIYEARQKLALEKMGFTEVLDFEFPEEAFSPLLKQEIQTMEASLRKQWGIAETGPLPFFVLWNPWHGAGSSRGMNNIERPLLHAINEMGIPAAVLGGHTEKYQALAKESRDSIPPQYKAAIADTSDVVKLAAAVHLAGHHGLYVGALSGTFHLGEFTDMPSIVFLRLNDRDFVLPYLMLNRKTERFFYDSGSQKIQPVLEKIQQYAHRSRFDTFANRVNEEQQRLPKDFVRIRMSYKFVTQDEVRRHFDDGAGIDDEIVKMVLDTYRDQGFMMGTEDYRNRTAQYWIDPSSPNFKFSALLNKISIAINNFSGVYEERDMQAAVRLLQKHLGSKSSKPQAIVSVQQIPSWQKFIEDYQAVDFQAGRSEARTSNVWTSHYASSMNPEYDNEIWTVVRNWVHSILREQGSGGKAVPILEIGGGTMRQAKDLRQEFSAEQYPITVVDLAEFPETAVNGTKGLRYVSSPAEKYRPAAGEPKPRMVMAIRALEYTDMPAAVKHLMEISEDDAEFVFVMNHPLSPTVLKTRLDLEYRQALIQIYELGINYLQGKISHSKLSGRAYDLIDQVRESFALKAGLNRSFETHWSSKSRKMDDRVENLLSELGMIKASKDEGALKRKIEFYQEFIARMEQEFSTHQSKYQALLQIDSIYKNEKWSSRDMRDFLTNWGLAPTDYMAQTRLLEFFHQNGLAGNDAWTVTTAQSQEMYMLFRLHKAGPKDVVPKLDPMSEAGIRHAVDELEFIAGEMEIVKIRMMKLEENKVSKDPASVERERGELKAEFDTLKREWEETLAPYRGREAELEAILQKRVQSSDARSEARAVHQLEAGIDAAVIEIRKILQAYGDPNAEAFEVHLVGGAKYMNTLDRADWDIALINPTQVDSKELAQLLTEKLKQQGIISDYKEADRDDPVTEGILTHYTYMLKSGNKEIDFFHHSSMDNLAFNLIVAVKYRLNSKPEMKTAIQAEFFLGGQDRYETMLTDAGELPEPAFMEKWQMRINELKNLETSSAILGQVEERVRGRFELKVFDAELLEKRILHVGKAVAHLKKTQPDAVIGLKLVGEAMQELGLENVEYTTLWRWMEDHKWDPRVEALLRTIANTTLENRFLRLAEKGLNEKGIREALGLSPSSWSNWKKRHREHDTVAPVLLEVEQRSVRPAAAPKPILPKREKVEKPVKPAKEKTEAEPKAVKVREPKAPAVSKAPKEVRVPKERAPRKERAPVVKELPPVDPAILEGIETFRLAVADKLPEMEEIGFDFERLNRHVQSKNRGKATEMMIARQTIGNAQPASFNSIVGSAVKGFWDAWVAGQSDQRVHQKLIEMVRGFEDASSRSEVRQLEAAIDESMNEIREVLQRQYGIEKQKADRVEAHLVGGAKYLQTVDRHDWDIGIVNPTRMDPRIIAEHLSEKLKEKGILSGYKRDLGGEDIEILAQYDYYGAFGRTVKEVDFFANNSIENQARNLMEFIQNRLKYSPSPKTIIQAEFFFGDENTYKKMLEEIDHLTTAEFFANWWNRSEELKNIEITPEKIAQVINRIRSRSENRTPKGLTHNPELPNIVILFSKKRAKTAEGIIAQWLQWGNSEVTGKANFILAFPEDVVIKSRRGFVRQGILYQNQNGTVVKTAVNFENPAEIHYAFHKYVSRETNSSQAFDGAVFPKHSNLKTQGLSRSKTEQNVLAREMGLRTKEILSIFSNKDYAEMQPAQRFEKIQEQLAALRPTGAQRIFIQPHNVSSDLNSAGFDLTDSKSSLEAVRLADWILTHTDSDVLVQPFIIPPQWQGEYQGHFADIRVIVTRKPQDGKVRFTLDPIKIAIRKIEENSVALYPEIDGAAEIKGSTLKNVAVYPLQHFLENKMGYSAAQVWRMKQELQAKVSVWAAGLYERGYRFDQMAVDFIVTSEQVNGQNHLHFIFNEAASNFGDDENWDDVEKQGLAKPGSWRAQLLPRMVDQASRYREKFRSESRRDADSIIKGWLQDDKEKIVLEAYDGTSFVFEHQSSDAAGHRILVKEKSTSTSVGRIDFTLRDKVWMSNGFDSHSQAAIEVVHDYSSKYKGIAASLMGVAERMGIYSGAKEFYAKEVGWGNYEQFYKKIGFEDAQPNLHYDLHQTVVKALGDSPSISLGISERAVRSEARFEDKILAEIGERNVSEIIVSNNEFQVGALNQDHGTEILRAIESGHLILLNFYEFPRDYKIEVIQRIFSIFMDVNKLAFPKQKYSDASEYHKIFYAAQEILRNALVHGNKYELDKPLGIYFERNSSGGIDAIRVFDAHAAEFSVRASRLHVKMVEQRLTGQHLAIEQLKELGVTYSYTSHDEWAETRVTNFRSEARANAASKGTFLMDADMLAKINAQQRDELFSTLYMNRKQVKMIVFNDRNQIPQDPAFAAILKLNNVRLTQEKSYREANAKYGIPSGDSILFAAPGAAVQNQNRFLKAVLLREQPGTFVLAERLLKGEIPYGIPNQNGVFDPPAEILATLNEKYLSHRIIAYAA